MDGSRTIRPRTLRGLRLTRNNRAVLGSRTRRAGARSPPWRWRTVTSATPGPVGMMMPPGDSDRSDRSDGSESLDEPAQPTTGAKRVNLEGKRCALCRRSWVDVGESTDLRSCPFCGGKMSAESVGGAQ